MYEQKENLNENTTPTGRQESMAVANSISQKKRVTTQRFGLIDNRTIPSAQRIMQRIGGNDRDETNPNQLLASQNTQCTTSSSVRVKLTDNQTLQRLKGSVGTAEAEAAVTFTLNQEFIVKHVANDSAEAKKVTEARISSGSPPGIVAGTAPNNLATEANWRAAVDASTALVPPDDRWNNAYGDEEEFVNQLTRVEVAGWEAQGRAGNVVVKITTNKKYLGGTWKVSGSKYNDDGDYIQGTGTVTMDISHLTS